MIQTNLNEVDENYMLYGTTDDVCIFCAMDYCKENHASLREANKALQGKLAKKKIIKIPFPGLRGIICQEHINRFSEVFKDNAESKGKD